MIHSLLERCLSTLCFRVAIPKKYPFTNLFRTSTIHNIIEPNVNINILNICAH